ncbi:5-formyltetrahydrofolate cyclo-ligase [Nocardioides solisilvae]|uniref:5-formyltetrahydrofolate cyclo-ligase n=1 Tax=Nocardioides solisilvae TaxID=1542435 RepID=UPI001EF54EC6|nr:5-formyltetrahydrofolate cyclo-ligase [Nocardioides solisilvae]
MSEKQVPRTPDPSAVRAAKGALRDRVLAARRRRSPADAARDGERLGAHLAAWPPVRRAAVVAAYVPTRGEPGTGPLLDALAASGTRVLLPVLLADGDLDWAAYAGPASLAPARLGLLEPVGPRLGVDAVARADVVLVPGLAVSPEGVRLGRGGGSYDRALARVPLGVATCVLLHAEEVGLAVPAEPHDRPVRAAATPDGVRLLGVSPPHRPGGPA